MRSFFQNWAGELSNPGYVAAQLKAKQEAERLADIGGALAGDYIPAFLQPGGAEAMTPEQTYASKARRLAALGSPELAAQFINTPETDRKKQELDLTRQNVESEIASRAERNAIDRAGLGLRAQELALSRQEAAAKREELAIQKELTRQDKRSKEIERGTEKLSQRVENTGAADLVNAFQNLKSLVPEEGDVPGYGATNWVPDFFVSGKANEIRQEVANIRNAVLKARSGGAVTPNEATRLLDELGIGVFKDDAAFRRGLKNAEARLRTALQNTYAGFDQDILDEYTSRGGITLDSLDAKKQEGKVLMFDSQGNLMP